MIEHVFRAAMSCDALETVYVATCDEEIRKRVEEFGGNVIMTSSSHERASDRVAEAAQRIEEAEGRSSEIVVMLQGDEPMITPDMIKAAVVPMLGAPDILCVNLVRRISSRDDHEDANTIKVVMNNQGEALYFSRAAIPKFVSAPEKDTAVFKQVCVIPFRRDFLHKFSELHSTPLEKIESIDMLRALEHGYKVHLVETEVDTHAVDTPEDLRLVETLMKERAVRKETASLP
jgi:3-deoxy-manno-octulosonate cytidylyltransferase (CMP-KDO synthetase)